MDIHTVQMIIFYLASCILLVCTPSLLLGLSAHLPTLLYGDLCIEPQLCDIKKTLFKLDRVMKKYSIADFKVRRTHICAANTAIRQYTGRGVNNTDERIAREQAQHSLIHINNMLKEVLRQKLEEKMEKSTCRG